MYIYRRIIRKTERLGGDRSTRWNNHEPKRLVEQTLRLDLRHPQLRPILRDPAPATWTTTITLGDVHREWLALLSAAEADGSRTLALRSRPLDIHEPGQAIQLVSVKAGFDDRLLARCPHCDRRAQVLHALPKDGIFHCRGCLGLGYASTRQWDKRVARLARAMRRGDTAAVRYWERRGALPGYAGFAADRLLLRAADRAFG